MANSTSIRPTPNDLESAVPATTHAGVTLPVPCNDDPVKDELDRPGSDEYVNQRFLFLLPIALFILLAIFAAGAALPD